jgi:hypothetical protein
MIHAETRLAAADRFPTKLIRVVLAMMLAFAALNAFGGGVYGLAGARGVPLAWLAATPFRDYFVPSFVLVGGSLTVAAVAVAAGVLAARRFAFVAAAILLGWLGIEVVVIGYVSWLQPVTGAWALVLLGLTGALPRAPARPRAARAFVEYYEGALRRPRATFEALIADPRRVRLGALAVASQAALYTLVYVFLVMGGGRPTAFRPWLAIDPEVYYRYDVFLLAPSVFAGWILASGAAFLVGRAVGGRGSFDDTASVLGFGIAAASWTTLLHDLVTSALGAFGVLDQRRYEDAMSSPTPYRMLIWTLMLGYLIAFLVLFTKGIGAAQRVRTRAAAMLALLAFAAYQGVFCLFNR